MPSMYKPQAIVIVIPENLYKNYVIDFVISNIIIVIYNRYDHIRKKLISWNILPKKKVSNENYVK